MSTEMPVLYVRNSRLKKDVVTVTQQRKVKTVNSLLKSVDDQ